MKQKIIKFLSRSWIYSSVAFGIMCLCQHFIPEPYGTLAGVSLIGGLFIAVLFHLYEE